MRVSHSVGEEKDGAETTAKLLEAPLLDAELLPVDGAHDKTPKPSVPGDDLSALLTMRADLETPKPSVPGDDL